MFYVGFFFFSVFFFEFFPASAFFLGSAYRNRNNNNNNIFRRYPEGCGEENIRDVDPDNINANIPTSYMRHVACLPDPCDTDRGTVVPSIENTEEDWECPSIVEHGSTCEVSCGDGYHESGDLKCNLGEYVDDVRGVRARSARILIISLMVVSSSCLSLMIPTRKSTLSEEYHSHHSFISHSNTNARNAHSNVTKY